MGIVSRRAGLRAGLLLSVAFAAPAFAADVEITSNTSAINLDTRSGTTVHVATGVTVSAGLAERAMQATAHAWMLTNDGIINSPYDIGFRSLLGATVNNSVGATIGGNTSAIVLGDYLSPHDQAGEGTVVNGGSIVGGSADSVLLWSGGTVTNLAGASITGNSIGNAVSVSGGTTRVVENYGTISNTGTGTYTAGVTIQGGNGSVTNYTDGKISGTANGVYSSGSTSLTLINQGLISSTNRAAVETEGGAAITNSGKISSAIDGIASKGNLATVVTNSGTIESTGSGRSVVFSGNASHTLILETGSVLTGNVQGSTATGVDSLVLRGTGSETLNKFLGFEILAMQGTTWTLTNSATFSDNAAVQAGRLVINGTLTSPTTAVRDGGSLGGSGTIASAVTVDSGGRIAPGMSSTDLTVTSVAFSNGSTYEVALDTGDASRLVVNQTATIGTTARVSVAAGSGIYADNATYQIIAATTVTGTFAGVDETSDFLDFALDYTTHPNEVWLTVTTVAELPDAAETPNQIAAATGIQEQGPATPLFDAIAFLDAGAARAAFDLSSGEIHATVQDIVLDDTRFVRDAVLQRLGEVSGAGGARGGGADPAHPRFGAWGQAYGSGGSGAGDGNAAGYTRSLGGLVAGVDAGEPGVWRLGAAVGYQRAGLSILDRASTATADGYEVAAYGGVENGAVALRFGGALASGTVDTVRNDTFAGFSETLTARYGVRTRQVFAEAAYRGRLGSVAFEPFANVAHVVADTDGFSETGGGAALSAGPEHRATTLASFGARLAAPLPAMRGRLTALIAWQHRFGDMTPTANLAFSGGSAFTIAGAPRQRDSVRLEAGVEWDVGRQSTLSLSYAGQIASGASDHGVKAKFAIRF